MLFNTATSDSEEGVDIFDQKKITIMTYEMFYNLNRFVALRHDAKPEHYHYFDKYNGKTVIVKNAMRTLRDYHDYLIYVF
uniref:Uncharacterized protein n=1 Tax=Lymantria dispar multicapsid nuclear polyhedrosis virus TaxID=10449 RepID=A0A1B1MQT6_NPVLD|nr:hypothetical protein [Lymantria dispar multiple nucleopolyhedrovirus]